MLVLRLIQGRSLQELTEKQRFPPANGGGGQKGQLSELSSEQSRRQQDQRLPLLLGSGHRQNKTRFRFLRRQTSGILPPVRPPFAGTCYVSCDYCPTGGSPRSSSSKSVASHEAAVLRGARAPPNRYTGSTAMWGGAAQQSQVKHAPN